MKNPDRTTFAVGNGTFPRRAELRALSAGDAESSSGLHAGTSHRFPTVPKLRRRVIPRVPTPYRETASQPPREVTRDTLPRVVSQKTLEPDNRRKAFVSMAVGVVLGFCTALYRLALGRP